MIAYSGRYVSEGETSIKDLSKEELDTSFRSVFNKRKEASLTIDNQKKTIGVLKKES